MAKCCKSTNNDSLFVIKKVTGFAEKSYLNLKTYSNKKVWVKLHFYSVLKQSNSPDYLIYSRRMLHSSASIWIFDQKYLQSSAHSKNLWFWRPPPLLESTEKRRGQNANIAWKKSNQSINIKVAVPTWSCQYYSSILQFPLQQDINITSPSSILLA